MAYCTELGDFSACCFTKATEVTPLALPSLAMAIIGIRDDAGDIERILHNTAFGCKSKQKKQLYKFYNRNSIKNKG